ncbi:MAG: hypothetical protein WD534_18185 [Phycisphaeraceae bacterium]
MNEKSHGSGTCLQCGQPTVNPRFCSRSCAATYNNRRQPKRRPESTCAQCGTSITTRQTYCQACRAKQQAERERQAQNIHCWRTPEGERVERPVERVWVSRELVFNTGFMPGRHGVPATCKALLDHLIGLVLSHPPYVRDTDVHRYASLLDAYKNYFVRLPQQGAADWQGKIADLPIQAIDWPAVEWVRSYFGKEHHPLMASYALDAVRFVEAHVRGRHWRQSNDSRQQENARIPAMLEHLEERRELFGQTESSGFKRAMTERNMRRLLVRAEIPAGGRMVGAQNAEALPAGTAFLFLIDRCHLSSRVTDDDVLAPEEDDAPLYDIAEEFAFHGHVQLKKPMPELRRHRIPAELPQAVAQDADGKVAAGVEATIPASWITDALRRGEHRGEWEKIPVPCWACD